MKPQIILFDEPFAHLDYPGIQEVLRHMIDLHRQGHTLVVTTHDVEKVISHVDRLAIIHNGELKTVGLPGETPHGAFSLWDPTSLLCSSWKGKDFMAQRIILHYFPENSPLHRWTLGASSPGSSSSPQPFSNQKLMAHPYTGILLGLLILSRLPLRRFLRDFRTWAIFLFILFLFSDIFHFRPSPTLLSMAPPK